eukprot:scaffold40640_cov44-Attheya_sp.AAC.1
MNGTINMLALHNSGVPSPVLHDSKGSYPSYPWFNIHLPVSISAFKKPTVTRNDYTSENDSPPSGESDRKKCKNIMMQGNRSTIGITNTRTICTCLLKDDKSYKIFSQERRSPSFLQATADGALVTTPRASVSKIVSIRTITSFPWTSPKNNKKIILFTVGSALAINLGYLDANDSPSRLLSGPDKKQENSKIRLIPKSKSPFDPFASTIQAQLPTPSFTSSKNEYQPQASKTSLYKDSNSLPHFNENIRARYNPEMKCPARFSALQVE